MDRNFFLPIAIAATIHSVLFMTGRPPADPPPPQMKPTAEKWTEIPFLPVDTPESTTTGESAKRPDIEPPPISPENMHPNFKDSDFIQEPKYEDLRPRPSSDIGKIDRNWQDAVPGGRSGPSPIFGPDMLDNTPAARFQPAPSYPNDLKPLGMGGQVTVIFSVDTSGKVFNESVVEASHSRFGEEALRAVRKWRFEPGIKDGKRVAFRMVQTFTFALAE